MARTTAEQQPADDLASEEDAEPRAEETAPEENAAEEAEETEAGDAGTEETAAGRTSDETVGDEEGTDETDGDAPRRRSSDPVRLVATVFAVVAAAGAGYFGWDWYGAAHDGSLAYSRDRDAVLRAAEQGVQNMNTLDYRAVEQGLASWEESSTGDLHQQLVQGRARFTQQVRLARTVTTAKILDGAVTELDDRAGKAGAIVAVQVTVTPPTGAPATKQSRMRAQLTRTPSGWKLSALGQAPVGTPAG